MMNFLLFTIGNLIIFSSGSELVDQLKNIHREYIEMQIEINELVTEQDRILITELIKRVPETTEETFEEFMSSVMELGPLKFKRMNEIYEINENLKKVLRDLILNTEDFEEKLDGFFRSGDLTIKEVSKLGKLVDDKNLINIDWENMSQQEKKEFYDEYISPAQEEDVIYAMNGQIEGKEFATFQRDEL